MSWNEHDVIEQLAPRPVRFFAQVDSSNDLAMAWLRDGAPSGAVIIADEQMKGRGRKGRLWHTPPGVALAVSVILRPAVAGLQQVSMLGGVVIAELCEQVGAKQVGIKWPNDVQISGLKVSGVLPEAAWDGDQLAGVVLGMGVNVRIDFRGTELEDTAISLETVLEKPLYRLDLLVALLARVDYWAARLGTAELFEVWRKRLTTIGRVVAIEHANQMIRGAAESVDSDGTLRVRLADGTLRRVVAGDIALGEGE